MRFLFRFTALLLIFALPGFSAPAYAEDSRAVLNFVNADIESTIKAAGVITGKNFIVDPRVKGTINIISNQPVARELVYPILLAALRRQGFAAIEEDGMVKIVPDAELKAQGGAVLGRKARASGGGTAGVVTQIFPLKYQSAAQLANTLRPLVSPNALLNPYPAGNTLVVTDYAENVARISQALEMLDQAPSSNFTTLPVQYASVFDVAQVIGRMMPEVLVQGAQSPVSPPEGVKRTLVVADLRSNSLLVRSENEVHLRQIRGLLTGLDQPGMSGSNIHVIYLRNAEATRLAATLKGILTGQAQDAATSPSSASFSVADSQAGASDNVAAAANTLGNAPAPSAGAAASSVTVGGATVKIQADGMTNSLIITAPDHIYNNLRAVIDQLDARRAQVYVEALIAEVNLSQLGELGVQWVGAGGNDKLGGGVISAINPASSGTNLASLYAGQAAGALSIPPGGYLGIFNGDPTKGTASLGLLASAIEQSGNGNVLSAPNLLMLDNEEARIIVGQNIPIVTGSYTTTASGSSNPFTTVDRKDIGIKLKVRPQVSDGGTITLLVSQEVSSIDNSVSTNGAGIATKLRTVDTKVLVDDGQTIVLGGLIQDNVDVTQSKVPLLGDIPWLGNFFRYESRTHQKVNLMIFLRPQILRDSQASAALSSERYQYLRAEQGRLQSGGKHPLLPDVPRLELPPLNSPVGQTQEAAPALGEADTARQE